MRSEQASVKQTLDWALTQARVHAGESAGIEKKLKRLLKDLPPSPAVLPAPAAEVEDKFYAKKLILGQSAESALGLAAALGLSHDALADGLKNGEQAMADEFAQHGSAEDKANLQYVLRGTALKDEDLPAHIKQQLREHKCPARTLNTSLRAFGTTS